MTDYKVLRRRHKANYNFNRENAIINNITNNRIFDAELIAQKNLVPKETPAMKAYREQSSLSSPLLRLQKEQLQELKEISDKPVINYNKMAESFVKAIKDADDRSEAPQAIAPETISPKESLIADFDKDIEYEVVEEYNLKRINEMLTSREELKSNLDSVDKLKRKLTAKIARDSKGLSQTEAYLKTQDIRWQVEELKKYTDRIRDILKNYNTLDLQTGSSILTTMEDIIERFKILYGEITSGNKNIEMINEFRDIILYLFKNKHITKDYYKELMKVK